MLTPMQDNTLVAQAMACLHEQKANYDRLLVRMEAQLEAAVRDDEPGLKREAEAIRTGIARARALDESLAETWGRLPGPARDELSTRATGLRGELQAALEKIMELENACAVSLREKKARLGQSIAGLRQGKTLLKAYSGPRPGGGRFSGNI